MERFDIVITGLVEAEAPGDPAQALADAFRIERERAEALLGRAPVTVKRDVDMETAERYFHVLRAIGITVDLRQREVDAPPPTSEEGAPPSLAPPPGSAPPPAGAVATASAASPYRRPADRSIEATVQRPFLLRLLGAFVYPLQKTGLPVLFGVGVTVHLFKLLAWWGSHAPLLFGVFAMAFAMTLAAGTLFGYLFSVIRHGADGNDDLPVPADFTGMTDLAAPATRYVIALVVCLAPAIVAGFLAPPGTPRLVVASLCALAGLTYMPAAIILAAHGSGCLGGLHLVAGFQLIARVPLAYAATTVAVICTCALGTVAYAGITLWGELVPVPFVPGLVATLGAFYFAVVASRMLGLFMSHHSHEL